MSMKNSNDTIGNRTRDLPACSAVLQPNAPPRTPNQHMNLYLNKTDIQQSENAQMTANPRVQKTSKMIKICTLYKNLVSIKCDN